MTKLDGDKRIETTLTKFLLSRDNETVRNLIDYYYIKLGKDKRPVNVKRVMFPTQVLLQYATRMEIEHNIRITKWSESLWSELFYKLKSKGFVDTTLQEIYKFSVGFTDTFCNGVLNKISLEELMPKNINSPYRFIELDQLADLLNKKLDVADINYVDVAVLILMRCGIRGNDYDDLFGVKVSDILDESNNLRKEIKVSSNTVSDYAIINPGIECSELLRQAAIHMRINFPNEENLIKNSELTKPKRSRYIANIGCKVFKDIDYRFKPRNLFISYILEEMKYIELNLGIVTYDDILDIRQRLTTRNHLVGCDVALMYDLFNKYFN